MEFEAPGPLPIITTYVISKRKIFMPTFGLAMGEQITLYQPTYWELLATLNKAFFFQSNYVKALESNQKQAETRGDKTQKKGSKLGKIHIYPILIPWSQSLVFQDVGEIKQKWLSQQLATFLGWRVKGSHLGLWSG